MKTAYLIYSYELYETDVPLLVLLDKAKAEAVCREISEFKEALFDGLNQVDTDQEGWEAEYDAKSLAIQEAKWPYDIRLSSGETVTMREIPLITE